MSNKNYTVMVAGMTQPDMQIYVKNYLKRLMQYSRQDKGCITYNIHQSIKDPCEFMIYEAFTSMDGVTAHKESEHFAKWKSKAFPLILKKSGKKYFQEYHIKNRERILLRVRKYEQTPRGKKLKRLREKNRAYD